MGLRWFSRCVLVIVSFDCALCSAVGFTDNKRPLVVDKSSNAVC